jgi:hypothetical protein
MIPPDASQDELEQLYRRLVAAVIQLAKVLGKPSPIVTRKERRDRV